MSGVPLTMSAFSYLAEVLAGWAERLALSPAEVAALESEFSGQAFTLAGVWNKELLEQIQSSLGFAIEHELTFTDWLAVANEILARYSVEVASGEAFQGAYAELVFRQNTINALAAGRYASMFSPEAMRQDEFWLYSTAKDDRVRRAHAALEGRVFRKDDPRARHFLPPLGFNCRCVPIPLDAHDVREGAYKVSRAEDATMEDEDGHTVPVTPDEGFDVDKVAAFVPDALRRIA
jgi:SPP1 gp7 family putative phage head morphogenesis protein